MDNWIEAKLEDHVDLLSGFPFQSKNFTEALDDIPLVKGDNLHQQFIDWKNAKRWNKNEFEKLKKFHLKQDDIVIAMDRPWIQAGLKYAWIKPNDPKSLLVQRVSRLRGQNGLTTNFLRYIVGNQHFTEYLKSIVTGVNVPHISGKQILNYKFLLPPLTAQTKIANILSAYDDLIENNNQRIQLLEEMASEIYKEWFVRLRFPGYQNTRFFDKNGTEVEHGTDGALPEGWDKKTIGETLAQIKRKPKVKKDEYLEKGLYPIIDQGNGLIGGYINDEKYLQKEPLPIIVFGDHTRRVKLIQEPFAAGADGTQFLYPKNDKLLPIYYFLSIKRIDLSNFHYARHFKFLKQETILIPSDSTLIEFNNLTSTFYKKIDLLRQKNTVLQQTRDLLLPRLISGKLSVEELDLD